jgi:hypothetical protein
MTSTAVEHDLLDLEIEYWHAMKDKSADAALKLTDEGCLIAGASGVRHLDSQSLAMMAKAPQTLHSFKLSDAQVHLVSNDVGIVVYNVHEELTVEGQPVALDATDSSVWVRRDGRWVCALHTESLKGDPFGRDRVASVAAQPAKR